MKGDLVKLLVFFDESLPFTDKAIGKYGFEISREDGVKIFLGFSIYEM